MAEHSSSSETTIDPEIIREWAESRGGKPATVKATHGGGEAGILRIMFPDAPNAHDENLEEIAWDEFFSKFEEAKLAFLYQDETKSGGESRFFKLVGRKAS